MRNNQNLLVSFFFMYIIKTLKAVIQKIYFPSMILGNELCYFSKGKDTHFPALFKIEDDIHMQILYAQYDYFFIT